MEALQANGFKEYALVSGFQVNMERDAMDRQEARGEEQPDLGARGRHGSRKSMGIAAKTPLVRTEYNFL